MKQVFQYIFLFLKFFIQDVVLKFIKNVILSDGNLMWMSRFVGFDTFFLKKIPYIDRRKIGYLSVASFLSILSITFGIYAFVSVTLDVVYLQYVAILFSFAFIFNIYSLLYAGSGHPAYAPKEDIEDWFPSLFILPIFLFLCLFSALATGVFESYYFFGSPRTTGLENIVEAIFTEHPFFFALVTLFFFYISFLPIVLRYRYLQSIRSYLSECYDFEKEFIGTEWIRTKHEAESLLSRYPTFEGTISTPYLDPPFNKKALIMGCLNPAKKIEDS